MFKEAEVHRQRQAAHLPNTGRCINAIGTVHKPQPTIVNAPVRLRQNNYLRRCKCSPNLRAIFVRPLVFQRKMPWRTSKPGQAEGDVT